MELIDGKELSAKIRSEARDEISSFPPGSKPRLTLVQVGEDPASSVYVKNKIRSCEECGIDSQYIHLASDISQKKLVGILKELSSNPSVHGILLQLPLPGHLSENDAVRAIAPIKDVDGFHPENLGLLAAGRPRYVPCTPLGIREMLLRYDIETEGKNVVILGRSIVVGKPMALLLSMRGRGGDATVTICNSKTKDVASISSRADILIAAMGKARYVKADMVRDGAVVIDVGINRIEDRSRKSGYRLVGDVDFDEVAPKTSHITPVPGGVGPMTVAMLMVNTIKAFSLQVPERDVAV